MGCGILVFGGKERSGSEQINGSYGLRKDGIA